MNRVDAISNRILNNGNFENVAHVCCDWEEFVFEVAEWGGDHIATVDFDTLTADEIKGLDSFIASFGCSPDAPHPCSKYANPIFAQGTAFIIVQFTFFTIMITEYFIEIPGTTIKESVEGFAYDKLYDMAQQYGIAELVWYALNGKRVVEGVYTDQD